MTFRPFRNRWVRIATAILGTVLIFVTGVGVGLGDRPDPPKPRVIVKTVHPSPAPTQPGFTLKGDDNGDGHIQEDESGWDCKTMGNKICGVQR